MPRSTWSAVLLALTTLTACRDKAAAPAPTASSAPLAADEADAGVDVGSLAPAMRATAHDGTAIDLERLRGRPVVLYFYPRDETSGCTAEAQAFRDAWGELSARNVVLVGISTDDLDAHRAFADRHALPFHLVSDPDGAFARAFGVPKHGEVLARQTVVIGPDGHIAKVYRKVNVTGHAQEILRDLS
jgi:thioredoxin-dependent peroxiredoxin